MSSRSLTALLIVLLLMSISWARRPALEASSSASTVIHLSQAKPDSPSRTITGRLVDESKKPIADAVVRPCQQDKKPDGSVQTFFAMHTNGTWATARTDSAGTFVFEGDLAPGKYCLAVETGGAMTILKGSTGVTLEVEVTAKPGKLDWGEIVVRKS